VPAPLVSVSHSGGAAAALVGDPAACGGVGIDIERPGRKRPGFEQAAFTGQEQRLLSSLGDAAQWPLRLWCAKESVAKAVGLGLLGSPTSLVAQGIDPGTGTVELVLAGELARRRPDLADVRLTARTFREHDLVVATSILSREV
jgi:phosphopantetheinyl transferase